jgi:hypothetical protein
LKEKEDEKIPDDELPHYLRKPKPIDMSKVREMGPEGVKSMSKKGKSLMIFVTVTGEPNERETEEITSLWQSSLFNANLQATRYIMESNKAIFMVDDGATAWEIKNFLIKQERCLEVLIDQETYPGLHAKKEEKKKSSKESEAKQKPEL